MSSLQDTSEKFKELFLLAFTRELIINSAGEELIELESEEIKEDTQKKEAIKQAIAPKKQFKPLPKPFRMQSLPRRLIIPVERFPPRLSYIRPAPAINEVDVGKLNKILADPVVQTIECHGPDKEVIVRDPSVKKTGIKLTKEEINTIVDNFAKKAKIPSVKGVFRVAVGRLIFSAIISDVVGTKFIIKKMPPERAGPTNLITTRAFGVPPRR